MVVVYSERLGRAEAAAGRCVRSTSSQGSGSLVKTIPRPDQVIREHVLPPEARRDRLPSARSTRSVSARPLPAWPPSLGGRRWGRRRRRGKWLCYSGPAVPKRPRIVSFPGTEVGRSASCTVLVISLCCLGRCSGGRLVSGEWQHEYQQPSRWPSVTIGAVLGGSAVSLDAAETPLFTLRRVPAPSRGPGWWCRGMGARSTARVTPMGTDWESILGASGADLADAYDTVASAAIYDDRDVGDDESALPFDEY